MWETESRPRKMDRRKSSALSDLLEFIWDKETTKQKYVLHYSGTI